MIHGDSTAHAPPTNTLTLRELETNEKGREAGVVNVHPGKLWTSHVVLAGRSWTIGDMPVSHRPESKELST